MKYTNGTSSHTASRHFTTKERNAIHKAGYVFASINVTDFTYITGKAEPVERSYKMIQNGEKSTIKTYSELTKIANS